MECHHRRQTTCNPQRLAGEARAGRVDLPARCRQARVPRRAFGRRQWQTIHQAAGRQKRGPPVNQPPT
eukprot:8600245-Alexandrium_andersonii.AAC.1